MDIEGRTAIITGGAVRVGGAITRELARRGASVFVHYNRSAAPAEALRKEIVDAGGVAAIGSVDLSDPECAGDLVAEKLGHVMSYGGVTPPERSFGWPRHLAYVTRLVELPPMDTLGHV